MKANIVYSVKTANNNQSQTIFWAPKLLFSYSLDIKTGDTLIRTVNDFVTDIYRPMERVVDITTHKSGVFIFKYPNVTLGPSNEWRLNLSTYPLHDVDDGSLDTSKIKIMELDI